MTFKAGDRVRLTGEGWLEIGRPGPCQGYEVTVAGFSRYGVPYFVTGGTVWFISERGRRYEAELVEDHMTEEELLDINGDPVMAPTHYTRVREALGVDVWDILDAAFDTPLLWNAGKYLFRAGHKDSKVQDLWKLIQYVEREIERLKSE